MDSFQLQKQKYQDLYRDCLGYFSKWKHYRYLRQSSYHEWDMQELSRKNNQKEKEEEKDHIVEKTYQKADQKTGPKLVPGSSEWKKMVDSSNTMVSKGQTNGQVDQGLVPVKRFAGQRVHVMHDDPLLLAKIALLAKRPTPLIINFCFAKQPGGSWRSGPRVFRQKDENGQVIHQEMQALGMEEQFFYQTSLGMSLNPGFAQQYYPLYKNALVYSPHVYVYRSKSFKVFPKEDQCFEVSFLSLSEVFNDERLWKCKIRNILKLAHEKKHKIIIFPIPKSKKTNNKTGVKKPLDLIQIFSEVFREEEVQKKFDMIVFATEDDATFSLWHNDV